MSSRPDPYLIDEDTPEWTAADFARARPIQEGVTSKGTWTSMFSRASFIRWMPSLGGAALRAPRTVPWGVDTTVEVEPS